MCFNKSRLMYPTVTEGIWGYRLKSSLPLCVLTPPGCTMLRHLQVSEAQRYHPRIVFLFATTIPLTPLSWFHSSSLLQQLATPSSSLLSLGSSLTILFVTTWRREHFLSCCDDLSELMPLLFFYPSDKTFSPSFSASFFNKGCMGAWGGVCSLLAPSSFVNSSEVSLRCGSNYNIIANLPSPPRFDAK